MPHASLRTVLLISVALLLGAPACRSPRGVRSPPAASVSPPRNEPRIFDVRARRFVDERTLLAALAKARFVLLGERHDHPEHHRLQARILAGLVASGRRPSVGWEMIEEERGDALRAYLQRPDASAQGLGPALSWERSGWPPWGIYRPIAEVAFAAHLPLFAAGMSRTALMRLHTAGPPPDALPASQPHAATDLLGPEARAELAVEIKEAHCGHASERLVRMMTAMQAARDRHLAERLLAHATSHGAVLIAGNGHVRRDRGVPLHLAHLGRRQATAIAVGILEVDALPASSDTRLEPLLQLARPFDFVWFTTRLDREDPCVKFKRALERMKRHR
ncbi:MAG: ChaN family lipoprotein [Deltaproteobacteria bacterium]|nr:ChaN family lipoprotein [Deltaproteobacteria bacterium]